MNQEGVPIMSIQKKTVNQQEEEIEVLPETKYTEEPQI